MGRTYVFRLTAEGVRELERDLKGLGETGERAFGEVEKRVPGLSGVLATANRNLDEHRKKLGETAAGAGTFTGALDRVNLSMASLIGRYVSWGAIIAVTTRALREGAEHNDEVARSLNKLNTAWEQVATSAAVALTPVVELTAQLLQTLVGIGREINNLPNGTGAASPYAGNLAVDNDAAIRFLQDRLRNGAGLTGGIIGDIGAGAKFDPSSRNWTPGVGGFPASGVTDLTAQIKEAETAQFKLDKMFAETFNKVNVQVSKMIADEMAAQAKIADARSAGLHAYVAETVLSEEQRLQAALKYGEEATEWARDQQAKRLEEETRLFEQEARAQLEYWRDVHGQMNAAGKDFWMEWADTGELNFKDLFRKLKLTFASTLYDMVIEAQLRPIFVKIVGQMQSAFGGGGLGGGGGLLDGLGSLFGGGGSFASQGAGGNWIPGAQGFPIPGGGFGSLFGSAATVAIGGSMIGSSIANMLGGSPTVGSIGGALLGGIPGGIASLLFKGVDKPSDMRSVATFMPGMSDYGVSAQSAHESSAETLGLAQTAAQAIMAEVSQLKAFGVEFKQQLANVWIGARDPSTYQLAGGQRVSVGSVGDASDLANDTLSALLKGATSSDPQVAAVLAKGGSTQDMLKALQFAQGITSSLLQITDPLQYALDIWEKTARANLAMAEQTGFSLEKVKEYNAALYQQTVAQVNGPAISGLDQFISSYQYGPNSILSGKQQITNAFDAYDAARTAALANPTAQTAQAFLGAANTYLPMAQDYWGSSRTYSSILNTALGTAGQLKGLLQTPSAPDLVTPMVSGFASTVDALTVLQSGQTKQTEEIKSLREAMESVMRRVFV